MHADEQFEIDFADEKAAFELKLRDQWTRNQAADAHNWTEEAMAMVWSLGRSDWESWENLPRYTRHQIVTCYRAEQEELEWWNETHPDAKRTHIRTYRQACPPVDEKQLAEMRKVADEMAGITCAPANCRRRNPTAFAISRFR